MVAVLGSAAYKGWKGDTTFTVLLSLNELFTLPVTTRAPIVTIPSGCCSLPARNSGVRELVLCGSGSAVHDFYIFHKSLGNYAGWSGPPLGETVVPSAVLQVSKVEESS